MGLKLFNGALIIDDAQKTELVSAKIGTLAGVLKGTAGDISAAVADTDYQQPVTWGNGLAYSSGIAAIDHTANLKITSNKLDTIQNIDSTASPTWANPSANNAPTAASHLTRKDYVDSLVQGLKPKDNCLVATTGNITLSGEQTIDGVLTSGSRVLVWKQTYPNQNGIYVSNTGAWTRATDADTGAEVLGAFTKILQGSTYAGDQFINTNSSAPVIGTDNITFADWGTTTNHNSLQGLQGGTTNEYYHLNAAQHAIATQAATASLNGYLSSSDWTTFNAKENALTISDGLKRVGDNVLSVDFNATNLKITSGQINTVQDINTGANVVFNKATIATDIIQNGLTKDANSQSLENLAEIGLEAGTTGFGIVIIGNFEEYAIFGWKAEGDVTLITSSTNVSTTDSGTNLVIYDAGVGPAIKNRLGSSKVARYSVYYS